MANDATFRWLVSENRPINELTNSFISEFQRSAAAPRDRFADIDHAHVSKSSGRIPSRLVGKRGFRLRTIVPFREESSGLLYKNRALICTCKRVCTIDENKSAANFK